MAKIDLRPPEFIKEREFYWPRLLMVVGIVFYGALLMSFFTYLGFWEGEEASKRSLLQGEYEQFCRERDRQEEEQALLMALGREKESLENLLARENKWHGYLENIFGSTRGEILIDGVKGDESGIFYLEGRARTLEGVAWYIDALQEERRFKDIKHKGITWHETSLRGGVMEDEDREEELNPEVEDSLKEGFINREGYYCFTLVGRVDFSNQPSEEKDGEILIWEREGGN